MKRSALILAGAVALNLGIMTATAEAQQRGQAPTNTDVIDVKDQLNLVAPQRSQTPPVRIPSTSTGPTFPGPGQGGAVIDPAGPGGSGGCTPGGISSAGGLGNPCGPAAYPPFHYERLPHDRCVLSHVPEGTVVLRRIRCSGLVTSCTASGGTVEQSADAISCRVPPQQVERFRQSIGPLSTGPTIPAPGGSALRVPPSGNPRPGASPPLRPR